MRKLCFGQTVAIAVCVAFGTAMANPTGPTVVSGAALLSNPSSKVLQVVNTPGTIINWNGFSIAAGETTRFVQLNAQSAVLNRAVGGNPSNILGTLQSNGRVFLINPNGIVFGGGSVVDVAGLIASTRDISNADFLAGNYRFTGGGSGTIALQSGAQILTSTYGAGGQVWLFAKNVTQEAGSTITAPQGQVVLAAGTQVQVATNGLGNMTFAVSTSGNDTVDSLGTIAASQGAVGMFADFVNHSGSVNAGNQGKIAMNATRDLKIQGTASVLASNGAIDLRGGRLLEVERTASVHADGASGVITLDSNDLRIYPWPSTVHGGRVNYILTDPGSLQVSTSSNLYTNNSGGGFVDLESAFLLPNGNVRAIWAANESTCCPDVSTSTYYSQDFTPSGQPIGGPLSIVSGSSLDRSLFPEPSNVGAASEWVSAPHWPTSDGGDIRRLGTGFDRRDFSGSLLHTVVSPTPGTFLNAISLADGTVLSMRRTFVGNGIFLIFGRRYSSAGTSIGADMTLMTDAGRNTPTTNGWGFATPDGGLFLLTRTPTSVITPGEIINIWSLDRLALTKVVAPYTPADSLTGQAGAAASFATRPGVSQGDFTPPPVTPPPSAPPPVVHGDPSTGPRNINFTQSGCNVYACDPAILAAQALLDAARAAPPAAPAAQPVSAGSAGDAPGSAGAAPGTPAPGTVEQAQQAAASAGVVLDTEQAYAVAVPELARAAGQPDLFNYSTAQGAAVLIANDGTAQRLFQTGQYGPMTPGQRLAVLNVLMERDLLRRQLDTGQDRQSLNDLVNKLQQMTPEQRTDYMERRAEEQRTQNENEMANAPWR